jgi:hypothetical protein
MFYIECGDPRVRLESADASPCAGFSVAILSLFVATLRAASQDHASRVDAFGFDFLSDSLILAAR